MSDQPVAYISSFSLVDTHIESHSVGFIPSFLPPTISTSTHRSSIPSVYPSVHRMFPPHPFPPNNSSFVPIFGGQTYLTPSYPSSTFFLCPRSSRLLSPSSLSPFPVPHHRPPLPILLSALFPTPLHLPPPSQRHPSSLLPTSLCLRPHPNELL